MRSPPRPRGTGDPAPVQDGSRAVIVEDNRRPAPDACLGDRIAGEGGVGDGDHLSRDGHRRHSLERRQPAGGASAHLAAIDVRRVAERAIGHHDQLPG